MEVTNINKSAITNKSNKATIQTLLESQKKQIALALPKHLTPDRLTRVALTAMSKNPKLLECSPTSLLGAVIQSAQLGLEPDGALGEAYLIPFKRNFKDAQDKWQHTMECQFMPGYRGIAKLVRNSGDVVSIMAKEVCANDFFEFEYGINEKLIHKPALSDRGEVIYFYCYVRLKDGGFQFEVMSKVDVDLVKYQAYRKNNPKDKALGNHEIEKKVDGVWKDFYVEMARKTVFKKLSKYLPMSVEAAKVFEVEENRELGKNTYSDLLNINTDTGEFNPIETRVQEDEASQNDSQLEIKPDLKVTDAKIVSETPVEVNPKTDPENQSENVLVNRLLRKISLTETANELLKLISENEKSTKDFSDDSINTIQSATKKQFELLKKKVK